MYSAFKEFYNLLSQVDSAYHAFHIFFRFIKAAFF